MKVILRNSTLVFQSHHIEHLPFLDGKAGNNSKDFVTININNSNNIATIEFDYQDGTGYKIASLAVGTVGSLKNQTTYLYMSGRLAILKFCKNWYMDWGKNVLAAPTAKAITGGYKVTIPPTMFEGLEDTDVIWFLQGQDSFVTKTFNVFISTDDLDVYIERT